MPEVRTSFLVALVLSLGFHTGLLTLWTAKALPHPQVIETLQVNLEIAPIQGMKHPPDAVRAKPAHLEHLATRSLDHSTKPRFNPSIPTPPSAAEKERTRIADSIPPSSTSEKKLASMSAPPPPTPEEWKLASTYTLRNSKRYRYNWGQLVRSKMGTAVEGPDQGQVRFRIEIAPDGKIAKVETLWTTSQQAEKLAMNAIQSMPPLPPTPTGKPLVFEQTISFEPFESGWPPSYKLDCLPEPLPFNNPFAWNGSSPPNAAKREHRPPPPEGCPPDSTEDTIEEEERSFKRQMEQWRWAR